MSEEHEGASEGAQDETITLETYQEEVTRRIRAEARAQVLLEAFVKLREMAANYAPTVAMSSDYEPLRKLLADEDYMQKQIDVVIERDKML